MADLKISAMTAASALVGTEVVPGVQSAANVKITAMQIGTYVAANLGFASGTSLSLGGNISAAAWTTAGIRYNNVAATMTDTTSSGTVAAAYTDVFTGNTIAASSATTFTNYYGAYFKNPVAGTNVTFTNKAALGADSLSIGGQPTAGSALAVNGTCVFNGNADWQNTNITNVNIFGFHVGTYLTSPVSNTLQFGLSDAASPVAQTARAQSVVDGTTNTAGVNWTLKGSVGTGTGAGGSIIWRTAPAGTTGTAQNALATALTLTAPAVNMQPSVVVGNQALATTATDGFLYIPTCAGTPTGTSTTQTGCIAMVYDTTNHQFWFYDGGWKQPKTPAGAALVTWQ